MLETLTGTAIRSTMSQCTQRYTSIQYAARVFATSILSGATILVDSTAVHTYHSRRQCISCWIQCTRPPAIIANSTSTPPYSIFMDMLLYHGC